MKFSLFAAAVAALTLTLPAAAGELKSGPQAGENVPGPFHPMNVTGENKGKKHCLFCSSGDSPVAMIFAREATPEVIALIKKIDAATVKNSKGEMKSFVVFLSDKEGLDKELASAAEKEGIKETVLSIDNPAGPKGYNVAEDANVTVVLYKERKVKANHAFKKGELKDGAIEKVIADIPKIME